MPWDPASFVRLCQALGASSDVPREPRHAPVHPILGSVLFAALTAVVSPPELGAADGAYRVSSSTYLGGPNDDRAYGVEITPSDDIVISGR